MRESRSQDGTKHKLGQGQGGYKSRKIKKPNRNTGSLNTPNSRFNKKSRKIVPNLLPERTSDGTTSSYRNAYAIIRRRWNIPVERSPTGFQKHHERTAAYLPVFSQQYKQWGYLRHQLSESELPDARRAFDRWYRRLGFVLIEPHRVKGRASWRGEASWILEYPSAPAMCSAWTKLDVDERRRSWPGLMLSAMLTSPERAADVLAATMSPLPPGYAITDVLQFVAQNSARHWPSSHRERAARADEIVHLMEEILVHTPKGHMRPSQLTFGIFAKVLPPSHTKELYDMMKREDLEIHENTALHFASTLSKKLEYKHVALEIILDMARKGANLNEAKFTSVITSLLHSQRQKPTDGTSHDSGASFSKKALEELMEQGLIPNVINLTAFLETLCWDGELDEAIRLALLFSESGAKLDSRTFNTVFKAAKESRDPEKMHQALDVAKAAKAPIVSVLNNALHAVFYSSEVERRETPTPKPEGRQIFEPLLRLYAQRFSLEPLQWLLPKTLPLLLAKSTIQDDCIPEQRTALSVAQAFFKETQVPRLQPDVTTLSIMLRAYILSLHHPYEVVSFYEYFKMKLESDEGQGINYARALVTKHRSLIHDTVVLAMLDHKLSTRQLLHVLGDMLRDNLPAKAAQSEDLHSVEEIPKSVHPAPTLFTLSILISRLLLRKEKMVATQLMDVMREHGIEPNLETWNAMVKGYAVLQDVPQTVSMLQRLEAAGYTPDNNTYKAFGRLKNQAQALKLMDSIIRQNEARLAQEVMY
ncbi:hypothetical protein NLU13_7515 [Sarocladium strictum]|uniref:Pentatricopeptide repeat-containing protein n=1 Tax=Sarocladium strictum TaxID=5046 RepID=A0AA39L5M8_SARSR|nr:hypothetical protein NLU13_7515 [Sarocladium strictum]